MKILVCDDQESRRKEVVEEIESARQKGIGLLSEESLTKFLKEFFDGVKKYLEDKNPSPPETGPLDGKDIVIIDNNLANLEIQGARLTAESIVGYFRAFSSAAYFVSLNKNPDVDFDLRYLIGDYATCADLALNTHHLGIPALWTGIPNIRHRFRPWYWPTLEDAARRRREQSAWVKVHLEKPVLHQFQFPASAMEILSRHAKGTLSPLVRSDDDSTSDGKSSEDITFKDMFVNSTRSLPDVEGRKKIQKRNNSRDREIMARIVAADLDIWLRRDVIGPQEVLVDVPHLLLRMPFLLGKKAADLKAWTAALREGTPPFGMDEKLYEEHLKKHRFRHSMWSSRPCFWWPELRRDDVLNNLFSTSDGQWAKTVFCEDTSEFESPAGGDRHIHSEFVAEFEGTWERRHVRKLRGFSYSPRSRFAL